LFLPYNLLLVHWSVAAGVLWSVQSYLVSMVLATYHLLNCIEGQHIFSVLCSPHVNKPCYSKVCFILNSVVSWIGEEAYSPQRM